MMDKLGQYLGLNSLFRRMERGERKMRKRSETRGGPISQLPHKI